MEPDALIKPKSVNEIKLERELVSIADPSIPIQEAESREIDN